MKHKRTLCLCQMLLLVGAMGGVRTALADAVMIITPQASGSRQKMVDLPAYRSHRLLLIFASSVSDPRYRQQLAKIQSARKEFEERDLFLFKVLEAGTSYAGATVLSSLQADYLRQHFEVKRREFRVVLVGKDGGVKRIAHRPVAMPTLFGQIDRMPIRQEEMRMQEKRQR